MFKAWVELTMRATMLAFEAQRVVGLRMMKLAAGGPGAQQEAKRMVAEKGAALAEATAILATGGPAKAVVRRYRTRVRANERRLSKPKRRPKTKR
jgi:hypothetical protein